MELAKDSLKLDPLDISITWKNTPLYIIEIFDDIIF